LWKKNFFCPATPSAEEGECFWVTKRSKNAETNFEMDFIHALTRQPVCEKKKLFRRWMSKLRTYLFPHLFIVSSSSIQRFLFFEEISIAQTHFVCCFFCLHVFRKLRMIIVFQQNNHEQSMLRKMIGTGEEVNPYASLETIRWN